MIKPIVLLLPFISFISCGVNEPTAKLGDSYTPLHIGDVQQMYYAADSSTELYTIVGKTKRTDGQDVFIKQRQYGKHKPDTSYFFIKNGFLTVTKLDTNRDSIGNFNHANPFFEQMLGVETPVNGMTWVSNVGDTSAKSWRAEYKGTINIKAGTLTDVYAFNTDCDTDGCFLSVYYAKGIGWIGSTFYWDTTGIYPELCYARIKGYEIGKKLAPKNPSILFKKSNYQYKWKFWIGIKKQNN